MKYRFTPLVLILLLVLIFSSAAAQGPAVPPVSGADAFVGGWVLNKNKTHSTFSGHDTRTITREGDDLVIAIRSSRNGYPTEPKGSGDIEWTYRCDGNVYPVWYGSVSCRYTDQHVIEGSNVVDRNDVAFGKHKPYFWKMEVTADGAEMKIYSYQDKAMTKLKGSTSVYDRQR